MIPDWAKTFEKLKKGKVTDEAGPGAEGTVIRSEPAGGNELPAKAKVDLVICKR